MSATAQRLAAPVPAAELASYHREVVSFHARRARAQMLGTLAACTVAAVCAAGMIAEGVAMARMVPLQRIQPLYIMVRPDGVTDVARALSELPASLNEAILRATMWTYVREREGFAYDTAQQQWDTVNAMSGPLPWQVFAQAFSWDNKDSPQHMIGRKGHILIQPISVTPIAANAVQVRYCRRVEIGAERPSVTSWTATLHWTQVAALRPQARLLNPTGLMVEDYVTYQDSAASVEKCV